MTLVLYLLALLAIGLGVGVAMGVAALLSALTTSTNIPLHGLVQQASRGVTTFPLLAVPFFIAAAEIMNASGITDRLFAFASNLVGHFRGGLAQINVVSSLLFSGMSGSSVADVSGIGKIQIVAMNQRGYQPAFSAAVTAASATVGPVVPPSIPFIIYAALAGVSPGALLIAGAVPGVLMAFGLLVAVYVISRRRHYPREGKTTLSEAWRAFRRSFLSLCTVVILVGGILSGVVTPTEAGILATVYAAVLAVVVYRTLSLRELWRIFGRVGLQSAVVLFIVAMASVLGQVATRMGIPRRLSEMIVGGSGENAYVVITLLVLVLLAIGTIMETAAALVVLTPIMVPIASSAGIDLVHFGVVMVLTLMIGLITPPFGVNMIIASDIADVSIKSFLSEAWGFTTALVMTLVAIMFVPALSLWLPSVTLG